MLFSTSRHDHSTVDGERLPSDVGGGRIHREKSHESCNFFGLSVPLERNALENLGFNLLAQNTRHVRGDETWRNGIARDVSSTVLPRNCLGERDDASLGSSVVRLPGVAGDSDDGGDVDDPPLPLLAHDFGGRLSGIKDSGEVRVDHLLPLLGLHSHHQRVSCDAGVVHQDIHSPPLVDARREHVLDVALVGHISLEGDGFPTALGDLSSHLLSLLGRARVVHQDLRSGLSEGKRDSLADAARSAGHHAHGSLLVRAGCGQIDGDASVSTRRRSQLPSPPRRWAVGRGGALSGASLGHTPVDHAG
mmetsp:Transcript_5647/g.14126  ORF Transcript_5647/g.14126 Transcript_5647/m.14126 type:complete len:305 (+) Transcript_5647:41-955(+)